MRIHEIVLNDTSATTEMVFTLAWGISTIDVEFGSLGPISFRDGASEYVDTMDSHMLH